MKFQLQRLFSIFLFACRSLIPTPSTLLRAEIAWKIHCFIIIIDFSSEFSAEELFIFYNVLFVKQEAKRSEVLHSREVFKTEWTRRANAKVLKREPEPTIIHFVDDWLPLKI